MKHAAFLGLAAAALMAAGCFNTNTWEETTVSYQTTVHEHVLVGYMSGHPDGSHSAGTGESPSEPRRRLTIAPEYIIIESYDGYTMLIPMNRLHALSWTPNPDAPEEEEET